MTIRETAISNWIDEDACCQGKVDIERLINNICNAYDKDLSTYEELLSEKSDDITMKENKEIWFSELGLTPKPQRAKVLQHLKDSYDVNYLLVEWNGFLKLVNIKDVCTIDEVKTLEAKEKIENEIKELEQKLQELK